MKNITDEQLNRIKDIVNLLRWKAFIAWWICKNLYLDEQIKDIDIFCYKEEYYEEVKSLLLQNFSWLTQEEKENDLMFQIWDIQLIKPKKTKYMRSYWTEDEVVETFDFTVCRWYILWSEEWDEHIEYDDDLERYFLEDEDDETWWAEMHMETKILIVKNIVCPISTIRRALKYATYWYYLPIMELLKLIREIEVRKMNLKELIKTAETSEDAQNLYRMMSQFD